MVAPRPATAVVESAAPGAPELEFVFRTLYDLRLNLDVWTSDLDPDRPLSATVGPWIVLVWMLVSRIVTLSANASEAVANVAAQVAASKA